MRAAPALITGMGLGAGLAFLAGAFPPSARLPGAGACRPPAQAMARIELLFGMGRQQGGEINESEWRAFVDAEITPRFPDGLTVLTGYGQWRGASGTLVKETSRVLLVWIKPDAGNNDKMEAIRAAWRSGFHQESVMRVDDTSCVSF